MITENELLKALEEAEDASSDSPGLTLDEVMAETGLTKYKVQKKLRELFADGRLVVGRKRVVNIAGIPRFNPTYWVKRQT